MSPTPVFVLRIALQSLCFVRDVLEVGEMAVAVQKRETPVSMRFRDDDLTIIDRGADLLGLSRTEFVRRAALQEAQMAILNETVIRVSPDAYAEFLEVIGRPPAPPSPKVVERLRRKAPWQV